MQGEWREFGAQYFPGEDFKTPWSLYLHAARIIIDEKLEVTIAASPEATPEGGIVSSDVADFLGEDDTDTIEIAKRHMAIRMASGALVFDLNRDTDIGLRCLIEEARGEISLGALKREPKQWEAIKDQWPEDEIPK